MGNDLKENVLIEREKNEKNEYSIYEYLKATPSVLITMASTLVALVTLFAKYITLISARKELTFWGIDSTYASIEAESFVFSVVISIVYSFLTVLVTMLFTATYEAYLSYKKNYLLVKYYKKSQKSIVKEMRKRCKESEDDSVAKQYCEDYDLISSTIKKLEQQSKKDLFINSIPIFILLWINNFLFVIGNTANSNLKVWKQILVAFIIQIATLWLLSMFSRGKIVNRKKMKKECTDGALISEQIIKAEYKEYPMRSFFSRGIKKILNNMNIIFVIIILLINCFSLCISEILKPVVSENNACITYVDDIQYAIVYQKGNQYFLEEAEAEWVQEKTEVKCILKIYTNKQRILTTDDLSINICEYDNIKRETKIDTE